MLIVMVAVRSSLVPAKQSSVPGPLARKENVRTRISVHSLSVRLASTRPWHRPGEVPLSRWLSSSNSVNSVQANAILQMHGVAPPAPPTHIPREQVEALLSRASSRSASPCKVHAPSRQPSPGMPEQPAAMAHAIENARRTHTRLRRSSQEPPQNRGQLSADSAQDRPSLTGTVRSGTLHFGQRDPYSSRHSSATPQVLQTTQVRDRRHLRTAHEGCAGNLRAAAHGSRGGSFAQRIEAVVSAPRVQAPRTTSASMAEQQRELKVQRERNSRLCDELRDERAMVGKLKGKLARREAEMRAEAAAASAAAQERVRFARASRVLASAEGRSSTGARSATLSSEVRSGSAISSAFDLSALYRTHTATAAAAADVSEDVPHTHMCPAGKCGRERPSTRKRGGLAMSRRARAK